MASALALSACGEDEPKPRVENQPSEVETTVAEQETPEDFVRRWFAVSKKMQNTGETSEYLAISSDKCRPCQELADDVTSFYKAGGWIKFQGNDLGAIERYQESKDRYLVQVESRPTVYRTAENAPVQKLPGGPGKLILTLEGTGNNWQVVAFHELAS